MRLVILSLASILLLQSCSTYKYYGSEVEGVYAVAVDEADNALGDSRFPAIELLPNHTIRWYGEDTTNIEEMGTWEVHDGSLYTNGLTSCLNINCRWDMSHNMRVDGRLLFELVLINNEDEVLFKVKGMNNKR